MSKKQGVKRNTKGGKAKGENYMSWLQRQQERESDFTTSWGKVAEQEHILIALKRMGLLGKKRLEQLNKVLAEVYAEYAVLACEDNKADKTIVYTKHKFDEELKLALGEYFLPWEIRHCLLIQTLGIRSMEMPASALAKRREMGKEAADKYIKEEFQKMCPDLREPDMKALFDAMDREERKEAEQHG